MKTKLITTITTILFSLLGFSAKSIEIGKTYKISKSGWHYVTVIAYKEKKQEVKLEFHDMPSLNGTYHKNQLSELTKPNWKYFVAKEGDVVLARKNTHDNFMAVTVIKSYIDGIFLVKTKEGKLGYVSGKKGFMKAYENLTTSGKFTVGQKVEANYNGFYRRAKIVSVTENKLYLDNLETIQVENVAFETEKIRATKSWQPRFKTGSLCESRVDVSWEKGKVKKFDKEKEQYLVIEDNSKKEVWVTALNIRLPKKYVNYAGSLAGSSLNEGSYCLLNNNCGKEMKLYINGRGYQVMSYMELNVSVEVDDKIYLDAGGYEGKLIMTIKREHLGNRVDICR